jgi:uncharacterized protein (TIGR03435 family)
VSPRWLQGGLFAIFIADLCCVHAQQARTALNSGKMPSFEVATIRPSKPGTFRQDMDESGNRLTFQNYTVRHLIREAYGLKSDSQILGGPEWIDKQGFDIVAKVDDVESALMDKMTDDQSDREWDLMLQSLLADRFQLKVRREDRALPVFALVVARSGAKFKHTPMKGSNAKAGDPGIEIHRAELTANAATMDMFADVLSAMRDISGRLVVNHTSLSGNFDFQLDWARDRGDDASQDSPYPGLFTALQEQLGLKLKPDRATVNVVVVDSVAEPTRN